MLPADNLPYDPLAEAIGWLVRGCAGAETWLNAAVADQLGENYRKVERDGTPSKVERLIGAFPELDEVGRRLLALFDVRHAVAHGIGFRVPGSDRVRLELYNRQDPASPKLHHLNRAILIALANEARELGAEIQMWLIDRGLDDDAADNVPEARRRVRATEWTTDAAVLERFPAVQPGQIYSMRIDGAGTWWGVLYNSLDGKPRMARALPETELT